MIIIDVDFLLAKAYHIVSLLLGHHKRLRGIGITLMQGYGFVGIIWVVKSRLTQDILDNSVI